MAYSLNGQGLRLRKPKKRRKMKARLTTEHVPVNWLLEYFQNKLPEAWAAEIEGHLAYCKACMALARKVRKFHDVVDHWPASSHAAALRCRLLKKLREATKDCRNKGN